MRKMILVILLTASAFAQNSVTLTWNVPSDADSTSTYNVYRTNNGVACANPTPPMFLIQNGVTAATYIDNSVTPGTYCYTVKQYKPTAGESVQSNQAGAIVGRPQPVTNLKAVSN